MKLIATIVATLALLFGGTVALAPAASADKNGCDPTGVCEPVPCKPSACGEPGGSCSESGSCNAQPPTVEPATCVPDSGVAEYRALVATQAAWIEREKARADRFERVANRRAATIRRLRHRLAAAR